METRIRIFLLTIAFAMVGCATVRGAEPAGQPSGGPAGESAQAAGEAASPSVITPQIERRRIRIGDIDTENWEAGAYVGALSVEDFGVSPVYGARVAYHVNEDFFIEGLWGTSQADKSSCELVSACGRGIDDDERRFRYYSLGLGWNALPGEIFVGAKRAYNSTVYLTAGIGSTQFADNMRFTATVGAGARVMLNDWLAAHVDLRSHILTVDVFKPKSTVNLEATVSLTAFF